MQGQHITHIGVQQLYVDGQVTMSG